ncbi:MAG TPA: hypothetical protein VFV34_13865, partial [Blastocatellia bacterium]|nr:hypothetical protein [Blastocatellia bacterium]
MKRKVGSERERLGSTDEVALQTAGETGIASGPRRILRAGSFARRDGLCHRRLIPTVMVRQGYQTRVNHETKQDHRSGKGPGVVKAPVSHWRS